MPRGKGRIDHAYVTRNFRARKPKPVSLGEKISNTRLGEVANYAAAAASWAVSKLNTELHLSDSTNSVSCTTTWQNGGCVTDITGGDDTNLRTGNEVKAEFLEVKGTVTQPSSDTAPASTRVLIVQDKGNPAGSAPTASSILQSTGAWGTSINYDAVDRFSILDDFVVSTSPGVSGHTGHFMRSVPLRLKHLFFESQSAGAFDQGAVYILAVTAYGGTTCTPTLIWTARVGFYDN